MATWLRRAVARVRRAGRAPLRVVYHDDYRLPLTSLQARTEMEPRRADHALWKLAQTGALRDGALYEAPVATIPDLLTVHTGRLVESLGDPTVVAHIFGVEAWDVPVDAVLDTVLRAVGGTILATRLALADDGPVLNLLGGFHHAAPDVAAGFCPVNDLAIAVKLLRASGFSGTVVILDLDAHPPDGTARCVDDDPGVWLGSISGSDWGPLPERVDETVLPEGAGDDDYLHALNALLRRAPPADLCIVIAGGDVVADDPIGALGLTEAGAMERDRRVARWCGRRPAVWLPGGGYGSGSWRRLAHTGLALAFRFPPLIRQDVDPLAARFASISRSLSITDLTGDEEGPWITAEDLPGLFGTPPSPRKFLGHYTSAGVLLALGRYGLIEHLSRLGYVDPVVDFDRVSAGERLRVSARSLEGDTSVRHIVMELVVERTSPAGVGLELFDETGDARLLFVHWLNLRNPLASFRKGRAPLPGQDVPGLGLAREAGLLLVRMAHRLDCVALLLRPAWFHVAWTARRTMRFVDPMVQGRFEAVGAAMGERRLADMTRAVAEGRVLLDDEPYIWEPAWMIAWTDHDRAWPTEHDTVRDGIVGRVRVAVVEAEEPS